MEPLQIMIALQILLSAIITIIGWFAKTIFNKVTSLNDKVLALSDKYVQKDDYKADTAAILAIAVINQTDVKAALLRIEEKLDTKTDKQ